MRFILFSLFGITLFFSCNSVQKNNSYGVRFASYLKSGFNRTLGNGIEFYFVIPTHSCGGCINATLNSFKQNKNKPNCFLVVNKNNTEVSDYLATNVLVDNANSIERVGLDFESPSLVITNKGEVQNVLHVNSSNIDSLKVYTDRVKE